MDQNQNRQHARILQVYNIYRLTLSLTLLLSFFVGPETTRVGSHDGETFLIATGGYAIFSLLVALSMAPGAVSLHRPAFLLTLFLIDILALSLIVFSSGGVVSGLGLLLLVTIAAGAIVIRGRSSTLLPAIASIALIYTEVYLNLTREAAPPQYMQAGLLGGLLFTESLYLQYLSERMQSSAALAEQQASSIVDLEQLNYLIIQRLRTGILLLDQQERIVTGNNAARELLILDSDPSEPEKSNLPAAVSRQLQAWKEQEGHESRIIQLSSSSPELRLNFAHLNPDSPHNVLVFIEDNSAFIQRARQMKLASLGRLTASIAHEIRNPLGAIGHAAQLLKESGHLEDDDRRLADIMLSHSSRINMIIEDILTLSRQREERAEKFHLRSWLENFIEHYRETHQVDGDISLDISPEDTMVRFIPGQLTQVLDNLFNNGLRYSKQETGKENLYLSGGTDISPYPGSPVLHIIDEGPGVSPEAEEDLFEPFHTTASSGTGLGLYISRELCEANHARLSYQRTNDGHSCFSIHFSHPDRTIS